MMNNSKKFRIGSLNIGKAKTCLNKRQDLKMLERDITVDEVIQAIRTAPMLSFYL